MPILRLAGAADSVAAWIAADTGSIMGAPVTAGGNYLACPLTLGARRLTATPRRQDPTCPNWTTWG